MVDRLGFDDKRAGVVSNQMQVSEPEVINRLRAMARDVYSASETFAT